MIMDLYSIQLYNALVNSQDEIFFDSSATIARIRSIMVKLDCESRRRAIRAVQLDR
jgi:hypothetical protein